MRGTLSFNGHRYGIVHLSTDGGSSLFFSRYLPEDDFEPILILCDFRLFVPGDGWLIFSGYRREAPEIVVPSVPRFEWIEAEFCPAGHLHDLFCEKRGGRMGGNGDFIEEVRL
jgi:hypothetical protein